MSFLLNDICSIEVRVLFYVMSRRPKIVAWNLVDIVEIWCLILILIIVKCYIDFEFG
jgi:hypothetical protein